MRISTARGPGGEVVHLADAPASALPAVTKRDLEAAWEAAQAPAAAAPSQTFRFAAPPIELIIADHDAAAWVAAVERSTGLGTPHGLSVCLRLLALIALMAQAGWARAWFALGRGGADIRPELLQAAALAPLTDAGGFDETALRALLPPTTPQGFS